MVKSYTALNKQLKPLSSNQFPLEHQIVQILSKSFYIEFLSGCQYVHIKTSVFAGYHWLPLGSVSKNNIFTLNTSKDRFPIV